MNAIIDELKFLNKLNLQETDNKIKKVREGEIAVLYLELMNKVNRKKKKV